METTMIATNVDPVVDLSHPAGRMTTSEESLQQEVRGMKDMLLGHQN